MTTPALEDTQILPPVKKYSQNIDNEYTKATTRRIIQIKVIPDRNARIRKLEEDLIKVKNISQENSGEIRRYMDTNRAEYEKLLKSNNSKPDLFRRVINYLYNLFNN